MTETTCTIDGCDSPQRSKGLCNPHYRRRAAAQMPACSIDGCESRSACRGWCWKHYDRWRKHGDPNKLGPRGERGTIIADPDERFWSKVEKTSSCWLWTGKVSSRGGYASYYRNGRVWLAHRWSYTDSVGPIPEGLVIDHLCRNTNCVRPAHLEAVTLEENSRRAALARDNGGECGRGHSFAGPAKRTRKDGTIYCGECANGAQAKRRAKYRAVKKAKAWLEANPGHEQSEMVSELVDALGRAA